MNTESHTRSRNTKHPFSSDILSEFDDLINGIFSGSYTHHDHADKSVSLPIDVVETQVAFEIEAELPGFSKDDINITVDDGVLTIQATRAIEKQSQSNSKILRRERRYGNFKRQLKLDKDVDDNNIQAPYLNGVLSLVVAKSVKVQAKKITING